MPLIEELRQAEGSASLCRTEWALEVSPDALTPEAKHSDHQIRTIQLTSYADL